MIPPVVLSPFWIKWLARIYTWWECYCYQKLLLKSCNINAERIEQQETDSLLIVPTIFHSSSKSKSYFQGLFSSHTPPYLFRLFGVSFPVYHLFNLSSLTHMPIYSHLSKTALGKLALSWLESSDLCGLVFFFPFGGDVYLHWLWRLLH